MAIGLVSEFDERLFRSLVEEIEVKENGTAIVKFKDESEILV